MYFHKTSFALDAIPKFKKKLWALKPFFLANIHKKYQISFFKGDIFKDYHRPLGIGFGL